MQRDPATTLVSDLEFHRLLCEFHGNTHLIAMLNRILDSLFPELLVSHKKSPDRMLEAVGEHEAVAAAVFQGDAAEAERLMARHLGSCQQFIMSRGARSDGRPLHALPPANGE
jgi:DNA-binding GntR family transcriptional regulator